MRLILRFWLALPEIIGLFGHAAKSPWNIKWLAAGSKADSSLSQAFIDIVGLFKHAARSDGISGT